MLEEQKVVASIPVKKEEKKFRPFGWRDQVGYMLGDIGGSFVNLYIGTFFIVFCTYVLGVSPYFMGTLFLVGKIYDAIITAIMGTLPDRFRIGKTGEKFKPWIRFSMWLLAASNILAFMNLSGLDSMAKHIWVIAAYLFFCTAYTADAIPYGSLASVISNDPVERTKLSRARSIGGMIVGSVFLSFVPLFIYDKAGNIVPQAFFYIAIIFSVLSLLSYFGLLQLTEERIRDHQTKDENGSVVNKDYSFKDAFKEAITNRPLIGVTIATLGSTLIITGVASLAALVFAEHYDNPGAYTVNQFVQMGMILLLFVLVPSLVKRFGKRNMIISTSIFSIALFAVLYFVPISNVWVFIALFNIALLGNNVFIMVLWALVTDCIDYTEYKTGKKYEGTLYSLYSFGRKIGMGLGASIGSYAMGWAGFVSGVSQQTDEVAQNLLNWYILLPIIAFGVILLGIALIYNLNNKKTEEMYQVLKVRRGEAEAN